MNIYEILPNESPVLVATINYTQTSSIYTNSFFTIHGGNNTVVVTMLHVGKIDGIARYQGYTQSFAKASVNSFILSFSEELDAINFLGNQSYEWETHRYDENYVTEGGTAVNVYPYLYDRTYMWLGIKESTYGYADLWSPLIDFTDYNRIVITGIQRFNNTNSSRYANIWINDTTPNNRILNLYSKSNAASGIDFAINIDLDISQYQGFYRLNFSGFGWAGTNIGYYLTVCQIIK